MLQKKDVALLLRCFFKNLKLSFFWFDCFLVLYKTNSFFQKTLVTSKLLQSFQSFALPLLLL